jgi:hypothetical protein
MATRPSGAAQKDAEPCARNVRLISMAIGVQLEARTFTKNRANYTRFRTGPITTSQRQRRSDLTKGGIGAIGSSVRSVVADRGRLAQVP